MTAAPPGRPLTIVFAIHPGPGHINASFRLAQPLRARGHRVVYYGLAGGRAMAVGQGFEFVAFAEDIAPERPSGAPVAATWWQRRMVMERRFRSLLRQCTDGTLDRQLLALQPELVVCDGLIWYVAVRAMARGIPVVNLCIHLCAAPNPHVSPVLYGRIPRDTWRSRLMVRGDWMRMRAETLVGRQLASLLWGRFRSPERIHHEMGFFRALVRRSGLRFREGRDYWLDVAGPHLRVPHVVMCPRALDFPQAPDTGARYMAGLIDVRRPEDTSVKEKLDRGKPLVYCSLGSDARFYPDAPSFFRAVADASRLRPEWQWVLSVGPHSDPSAYAAGNNLAVVKWAPQMALLGFASVMVTHGGLNSMLECIHFGVPMVVAPAMRDQPGNMARAVAQGIAVGVRMKGLRAAQLAASIEQAMHSTGMRQRLAEVKQAIAAEDAMAAVKMVESLASGGGEDMSR